MRLLKIKFIFLRIYDDVTTHNRLPRLKPEFKITDLPMLLTKNVWRANNLSITYTTTKETRLNNTPVTAI